MAKARKASSKAAKKRAAPKRKSGVKRKKTAKRKSARKAKSRGLSGLVSETRELRQRLAGHNTFED